jgi:hypothetical protein
MTKITFDQMSAYLNSGAILDDVISMIEMMQEYKEEVLGAIADWQDLIPQLPEDPQVADDLKGYGGMDWGDRARHKQLKEIVTWLMRHGYAVGWAKLDPNGYRCSWEVFRDEQIGKLIWDGCYTISGIAKVETSPNQAFPFPDCLTWV